jgi:sialic acid synthase SpsE
MNDCFAIGNKIVGPGAPVFVIAEIGINHEGSVEKCAEMIRAASGAGADAIKLQTVDADIAYAPNSPSYELFKRSALSREETAAMFALARELGMVPLTTIVDEPTLSWIRNLRPDCFKVSSGLLSNTPFISRLAGEGKPLIMSTGLGNVGDIEAALSAIDKQVSFALLQCTSLYPCPDEEVNLSAIQHLAKRWSCVAGYSDHSQDCLPSVLSVMEGAAIVEKHFTLDQKRAGFDHAVSAEPAAFKEMVSQIHRAKTLKGSGSLEMAASLEANRALFSRCVVALKDLTTGTLLDDECIGIRRPNPGNRGAAPEDMSRLVGRVLKRSVRAFDGVVLQDTNSACGSKDD